MYKYSKRNNQQEFSLQPASFSSEISLCGNITNANFRPREISRVRIFAMAKFRWCEFSLWRNFAGANFRYPEISLQFMRNFVKITAKFRLTQRKFVAKFRRIFARTKNEKRRISFAFLLHSTVFCYRRIHERNSFAVGAICLFCFEFCCLIDFLIPIVT